MTYNMYLQIVCVLMVAYGAHGRWITSGCTLDVNSDLPSPQPLFILPTGTNDLMGFLQPDRHGVLHVGVDQQVLLACPGTDNGLRAIPGRPREAMATCVSEQTFKVDGHTYDVSDLACVHGPTSATWDTGYTCFPDSTRIHVGYNVSRGFMSVYHVCFNHKLLAAISSHVIVVASISGSETGVPRPDFKAGPYYGSLSPSQLYKRHQQVNTIGTLLRSMSLAHHYIPDNGDYFLARGHLTPKADLALANLQAATFYYVNVAPQWQTFNGGNWVSLEGAVRALAAKTGLLHVYTGTHGTATLPDVDGVDTRLFLHVSGHMPVPQFYWKVVYHNTTRAGVAFVGINNPYVSLAERPDLALCTDVCGHLTWLTWQPHNIHKGEAYCCHVAELRKVVTSLPDIVVDKLLV